MLKLGCALAAMLVLGCSSPQRRGPASPCERAATNIRRVFDNVMVEQPADKRPPPDLGADVAAVVLDRCTADAWPAEAISCLTTAADGDAIEACAKRTLTPAQNDAVDDAIEGLLDDATANDPIGEGMEGGGGGSKGLGGDGAADDPCGGDADGASDDPCGGGE